MEWGELSLTVSGEALARPFGIFKTGWPLRVYPSPSLGFHTPTSVPWMQAAHRESALEPGVTSGGARQLRLLLTALSESRKTGPWA